MMTSKLHPTGALSAEEAENLTHGEESQLQLPGFFTAHVRAMAEEGFLGTLVRDVQPHELRERLKAMWTTLGVVSALLAGIVLPTVISPQVKWQDGEDVSAAAKAFVYCIVIAFGLSFTVVNLCSMLIFSIDLMPTNDAIKQFVRKFQYLSDISALLFLISVVTLMAGCVAAIYENYGQGAFLVHVLYLGMLLLFMIVNLVLIQTNNAYTILRRRELHQRRQTPELKPEVQDVPLVVKANAGCKRMRKAANSPCPKHKVQPEELQDRPAAWAPATPVRSDVCLS